MRILLVGTAYPLRGGIAHYIALLRDALVRRGHEVRILTFKRQYPKLLFPGKSQEEADSNSDATLAAREEQLSATDIVIDSIDPLSWLRAGAVAATFQPDLILFKYWMPFFAPAYGVIARVAKRRAKRRGQRVPRIVFIADNVIPHETRPGDMQLTHFAFRVVDHFIVHSDAVERELLQVEPHAKHTKLPHGIFEIFGKPIARDDARRILGLPQDAPVILFFGYIRKYKGLDLLLRAAPALIQRMPDLRIVVAGEFYGNEAEHRSLIASLGLREKNLLLATDYIPNEEVSKYFAAANVVVLPYRSATQSGIVPIAYQFDRPVIVTDVGGLRESVEDRVSGLIAHEATPEAIAEEVLRFFNDNMEAQLARGVADQRKKYSWDTMAEGVEKMMASDT
jgi:glycosyltransferase involved in cell wall biosynthesis